MANPQTEHGYMRIANEIWDEVIRRNFSKRQKDILLFIWRLSYGCRRKAAHIPKLKDFSICGVPATQTKSELTYLETARVLIWERESKMFSINKDYELWQINPGTGWDKDRFDELIHLNLTEKTSQNMNFSDDEKPENFTKHEVKTSQNMKSDFTKREVGEPSNPHGSKAETVSKDSIKDSIKITTLHAAREGPPEIADDPLALKQVVETFSRLHGKLPMDVGMDTFFMTQLLDEGVTALFITRAMEAKFNEQSRKGKKINGFKYYVDFIREAWQESQSVTAVPSAVALGKSITESPVPSGPVALGRSQRQPGRSRHEQGNDVIRKLFEEGQREEDGDCPIVFNHPQCLP